MFDTFDNFIDWLTEGFYDDTLGDEHETLDLDEEIEQGLWAS